MPNAANVWGSTSMRTSWTPRLAGLPSGAWLWCSLRPWQRMWQPTCGWGCHFGRGCWRQRPLASARLYRCCTSCMIRATRPGGTPRVAGRRPAVSSWTSSPGRTSPPGCTSTRSATTSTSVFEIDRTCQRPWRAARPAGAQSKPTPGCTASSTCTCRPCTASWASSSACRTSHARVSRPEQRRPSCVNPIGFMGYVSCGPQRRLRRLAAWRCPCWSSRTPNFWLLWLVASWPHGLLAGLQLPGLARVHRVWRKTTRGPATVEQEEWALAGEGLVDYFDGGKLMTFLCGALNYQVTHHLFPTVSQYHYPAIAPIIMQVCEEYKVRYPLLPDFRAAFGAHIRHLYEMGQRGEAAEVHVG
ncbi:unnamed protein product [Heterosigma akashiwo]